MEYKISDKMVNMKPSAIREIFKSLGTPGAISFAAGNPAPESFPVADMARIGADIFANSAAQALQYSVTEGYPKLREQVKKRLLDKFGIGTENDDLIIVTGGQQGIELTCKVMCNEGDTVIAENPSFIGALNAFRSLGAKIKGVPLTEGGMDTAALEETLKANPDTKLIYVIPTFQNPAGSTTSLETRQEIYRLARKYDVVILEDNPYGELRFAGEDIPTIKKMDTDGRVLYCGSFSKVLSAGMRIGFLLGPKELIQKVVVAKQVEDVHTNIYFQMLCSRYMDECDMDAHVEEIRALYRKKCGFMLECLDKYMPSCVKYTRPEGGLFLWCTLPDSVDSMEFIRRAGENLVFVVPGTAFNCDETAPSQSFRLNYSMPSMEEIEKGIKILGGLVKEMA
ncbi:MAG: PLP-dependent aminotransferase family protein [Lachnospiraceae bacterium]|nr:PLP-dependent aminotransferase family protein [Lachnospiraceae bacterium]